MSDAGTFALTRPRRHEEDDLQRAVTKFLSWCLPENACWLPFPNGGWRWKSEAARMVGLGQVRAGVPDLEVIHAGHPLFIELKTATGVLSSLQRQMHQKLERAGADVYVCRTPLDVQSVLLDQGVQLRGKLG